jgi:outer membrane protein TolC
VATNYIDLRAFQEQLAIARRNLEAQGQSVEVTRERFRLGLTSQLDVAQAEGQAATTAADIPGLERDIKASIHRLGILTGQPPESLTPLLAPPRPQPSLSGVLAADCPRSFWRGGRTCARRSGSWPRPRRTSGWPWPNSIRSSTSRPGWAFRASAPPMWPGSPPGTGRSCPGCPGPLFDMGKARAGVEKSKALFDEALAAYRAAFHTALEDVENALAAYYAEAAGGIAWPNPWPPTRRPWPWPRRGIPRG